jgi:hypothetical protein
MVRYLPPSSISGTELQISNWGEPGGSHIDRHPACTYLLREGQKKATAIVVTAPIIIRMGMISVSESPL